MFERQLANSVFNPDLGVIPPITLPEATPTLFIPVKNFMVAVWNRFLRIMTFHYVRAGQTQIIASFP